MKKVFIHQTSIIAKIKFKTLQSIHFKNIQLNYSSPDTEFLIKYSFVIQIFFYIIIFSLQNQYDAQIIILYQIYMKKSQTQTQTQEILFRIFEDSQDDKYSKISDALSVNSSVIIKQINKISDLSRLNQISKIQLQMKSEQKKKKNNNQENSECHQFTSRHQKNKNNLFKKLPEQNNFFNNQIQGLAFCTGNLNKINISEEYLEKGRKAIQDQQDFSCTMFTTGNNKKVTVDPKLLEKAREMSISSSKNKNNKTSFSQQINWQNTFKSGNNKNIDINAENVKKMMKQFDFLDSQQYFSNPVPSAKKDLKYPTKTKKLKTNKQELQLTRKHKEKRNSVNNKKALLIQEPKPIYPNFFIEMNLNFSNYTNIKLKQLQNKATNLEGFIQPQQFYHDKKCKILYCYFCQNSIFNEKIYKQDIFNLMCKKYKINRDNFDHYYSHSAFKLFKYDKFYPDINNKRLQASNILKDIEKKYCLQVFAKKSSSLKKLCQNQLKEGIPINLIIKAIHYSQIKSLYFIQLSDGWYSIYAVIHNQLRSNSGRFSNNFLISSLIKNKKLFVGCKIKIAGWKLHPMNNILLYLPVKQQTNICIQIFYNSMHKIKSNSKLGVQKDMFYYRPLIRCLPNGGYIYLCQLFIIKKLPSKKFQESQNSYFFLKVADEFKNCYILKIYGGVQLSDYFKQKQLYHLYKLKMLDNNKLEAINLTSYVQIKLKNSELLLEEILKTLLLKPGDTPQEGRYYDLIIKLIEIDNKLIIGQNNKHIYKIELESIPKDLNKWIDKIILLEQILWQDGKFRSDQFTTIRKEPKQKYYKKLIEQFF